MVRLARTLRPASSTTGMMTVLSHFMSCQCRPAAFAIGLAVPGVSSRWRGTVMISPSLAVRHVANTPPLPLPKNWGGVRTWLNADRLHHGFRRDPELCV